MAERQNKKVRIFMDERKKYVLSLLLSFVKPKSVVKLKFMLKVLIFKFHLNSLTQRWWYSGEHSCLPSS